MNGKRIHEIILLNQLLKTGAVSKMDYIRLLEQSGTYSDDETLISVENYLTLDFFVTTAREKYGSIPIIMLQNDTYYFNNELEASLQKSQYKSMLADILSCAYEKNKQYNITQPFTLYKKYSRKDICRLLNWDRNEEGTLNGVESR